MTREREEILDAPEEQVVSYSRTEKRKFLVAGAGVGVVFIGLVWYTIHSGALHLSVSDFDRTLLYVPNYFSVSIYHLLLFVPLIIGQIIFLIIAKAKRQPYSELFWAAAGLNFFSFLVWGTTSGSVRGFQYLAVVMIGMILGAFTVSGLILLFKRKYVFLGVVILLGSFALFVGVVQ